MKKKLSLFTLFLVMPFVIFGAIQIWWYSQAPHATSVNDTDIMLVERPVPHTNLWFNMAQLRSYTSTGITNLTVSNAYITNIYVITGAVDNITVTNGITNLSLTPNTVLQADANKRITSIPNGTGALTNDGAGNFGWNTSISGASGPWTNSADFTWLSGFTMATNGAYQTAPFSFWTNGSLFIGPTVFQDIAQDPTTVHFPYGLLMTDSNGPTTFQFSMNVYDSESGTAASKWFSTVSPSQSSATYQNSIHGDSFNWHIQTISFVDFSTNNGTSIFHIDNEGLTTANGYVDTSGTPGQIVAYGTGNRLFPTNMQNYATTNQLAAATNNIYQAATNYANSTTNGLVPLPADASGALTNSGAGVIGWYPSYATQPGNNLLSGSNYVSGVFSTSTNSCNGIPDFSVIESVFSTNNAIIFGAPINGDSTDKSVEWLLVNAVNTTASVVPITAQGSVHVVGIAYCTNITACWYQKYGKHFTNLFLIPVY